MMMMMMVMMMMIMYKVSDIFNLKNRSFNVRNSDNFMIPRIFAT